MLGAVWRWLRGDYKTRNGRISLLLKAITWALLYLIHRRNVASEPYFESPLRETLGDDYKDVAARSQPTWRPRLSTVVPNERLRRRYVEKSNIVRYGPHGGANLADVWRRRDLFNILYGTPPMYMFTKKQWDEGKAKFVESAQQICAVARRRSGSSSTKITGPVMPPSAVPARRPRRVLLPARG